MEKLLSMQIVDFGSALPEISESRPPADRVLSGDPITVVNNYFSDSPRGFHAGVWKSTIGRWRVSYSEHEFCHITSGRVRIQNQHGSWQFASGQSFVIPAGFEGTWEVLEPMSKLYVIYELSPAPATQDSLQDLCAPT